MWNDEDNNPYGDFDQRDSESPELGEQGPSAGFGSAPQLTRRNPEYSRPVTPPSPTVEAPDYPRGNDASDDEGDLKNGGPPPSKGRKEGGYQSRVEQILYEKIGVPIVIVHAGKNQEGGGNYIAYTIRTGDVEVRRRYSDFYSLRQTLVNLHPTLIIPPIPEKHSMADYAAKPTKAKEDEAIIDHRKRMLTSFLNRCRRIEDIRDDGVFWKFLDPNASWNEVMHSPPVSTLPKNNLKAPPLDPANPTPGHNFLPVPSSTAKLKGTKDLSASMSGTPISPPPSMSSPSSAAHTTPGPQIFGKFPPVAQTLPENELDPYFVSFEASSRELEILLQGSMEKTNKRMISHLTSYSEDLLELGARLNGFSLSEQSPTLAAAIEKTGQAADSTYIATSDLSKSISAGFSEPMRESAQFAGIVRNVLRYRILKRVQGEMTRDELEKKRMQLSQLEQSEMEAQRIEQHLQSSGFGPASPPKRSFSTGSTRSSRDTPRREADNASVDSDFPALDNQPQSSAAQGSSYPKSEPTSPATQHKKSMSGGGFVANKIFGRINHAIHGFVDVDPERTRRDQIGKIKESLAQLEQALEVSEKDVRDASSGVLKSLRGFQKEKEDDLRRCMVAYARSQIDWAKKNQQSWEDARQEVDNIEMR